MKTLIFGAGPLGSLYACLLYRAGNDVTLLARDEHYDYLKENGVVLYNEFSGEKMTEKVKIVDSLKEEDVYDLIIVIMRKNSLRNIFPILIKNRKSKNILFMGNTASGFSDYLKHLPEEKVLFGFPGGGGSRIDHVVHYVDSEEPNGKRMGVTLGEIDGQTRDRTIQIKNMFESAGVPVRIVEEMDGWLKYHVAFVQPLGGALLKAGDNYKLAQDKNTIRTYLRAVKESGRVLKALGYKRSYNIKLRLFYLLPEFLVTKILNQVFNTKFAEVAMMMHVNAAKDEMIELADEFRKLRDQTTIQTPNLDELIKYIH